MFVYQTLSSHAAVLAQLGKMVDLDYNWVLQQMAYALSLNNAWTFILYKYVLIHLLKW